ncbi:FAD-dependent oxidoreductase [Rhodospirillaceae bacterium KN72]|uniref:FAD-dependent oxidoreductase n=1 Tax=Pacificispira spongiicola TaxID=2729598 RepID=A0A7Y0DXK1_9PROT|nr:FAD-dependent oxidoreductase [Pacificispira spongiicola]NMM43410.1 FAD-dependent oxidoreductase [Pacificispira spongiicola]
MAWFQSIPAADVHTQGAVGVEVDGLRIALFSLDGDIHATGNICTHAFALLTDGHVENGCVECPLHQGLFDIRTGKAQGTPVTKDIATYAVDIRDGQVWVDTDSRLAETDAAPEHTESMPEDPRALLIVGAGQAGVETAVAARQNGFAGTITLIGDEPVLPYERPPLSKGMLMGESGLDEATIYSAAELDALKIELLNGIQVSGVDRKARRVSLSDGRQLSYDMLVLATGARARELSVTGSDETSLFYLRNLRHAKSLGEALRKATQVAVIGGGFIGLEIASAARKLGKHVTVIEAAARLMGRLLPEEAAGYMQELAVANGVALELGHTTAAVSREGVMLDDGRMVAADCIVVGIGAVPNDALAREAGLAVAERGGILVNPIGRTSDPAIYAVGDVAVHRDEISGREHRLESWQNANLTARSTGMAIAGAADHSIDLPWFWSDLFGGTVQMLGQMRDGLTLVRRDGGQAPVFFGLNEEGSIELVVDFGQPKAIQAARSLMLEGTELSPALLTDRDVDLSQLNEDDMKTIPLEKRFVWPATGLERIPDWVYTDQEIFDREVERIFHGRTWNYVGLEAEIPNAGDFIRSYVGPTAVVVSRDEDGGINVFENRCAHRAAEFCRELHGNTDEFVCPYHQWSYDLKGNLAGIPFRRGAAGKGGMGPDFQPEKHGLRCLSVATRNGAIFASFASDMESVEDYLGEDMLKDFDAVFSGRKIKVLGHYRHTLSGNWKLYPENLKDPYHATLLHTFLVTFGLLVAGNKSAMIVDPKGRHSTMASAKSDAGKVSDEDKSQMRAYRDGMTLEDPRMMDFVPEFDSPWSVTMQVVWPNLIVQREMNTLGVRQINPTGPNEFTMVWTMFGYEDDDEEMTRHRLRQGNLMGPAGYLGMEDNEAIKFVQDGMLNTRKGEHLIALDPEVPAGTSDTLISEAAIRAMYKYWRQEMGL